MQNLDKGEVYDMCTSRGNEDLMSTLAYPEVVGGRFQYENTMSENLFSLLMFNQRLDTLQLWNDGAEYLEELRLAAANARERRDHPFLYDIYSTRCHEEKRDYTDFYRFLLEETKIEEKCSIADIVAAFFFSSSPASELDLLRKYFHYSSGSANVLNNVFIRVLNLKISVETFNTFLKYLEEELSLDKDDVNEIVSELAANLFPFDTCDLDLASTLLPYLSEPNRAWIFSLFFFFTEDVAANAKFLTWLFSQLEEDFDTHLETSDDSMPPFGDRMEQSDVILKCLADARGEEVASRAREKLIEMGYNVGPPPKRRKLN